MDARLKISRLFRAATVALAGCAMACGLLILFGGLALPATAAPLAKDEGGVITTNTTWYAADNPHVVTTTVIVTGGTLTLEPGVVVSFTNDTRLTVQSVGRLVASGTSTQPIQFTSTPGTCRWLGVQLYSDNNVISYASFKYAAQAIKLEVGSDDNTITFDTFQNNGGCTSDPLSGAIIGSTDSSDLNSNVFTANNTAIYLSKSSDNSVARNVISGTTEVALSFYPSAGTRSSDNTIISNTVHHAGGFGIYVTVGDDNSILENNVYSNQLGGIGLDDQTTTFGNRLTVRSNNVYSNSGPGLYITFTRGLDLGENLIWGNSRGVLWDLNNAASGYSITRNVVCRNTTYLFRNNDTSTAVAESNWWGKNNPLIGSEISGTVDITPRIQLTPTPANSSIRADGTSSTVITVTFNDGGSNTVPAALRVVTLTNSAGTLSPTVVTVNSSGIATTSLRSTITPTVATVTATEWCGFATTTTVTFAGYVDLNVGKTASDPPYGPGNLITYTISFRNNGNATANGVVLTETPPLSTTFAGPVGASGWFTVTPNTRYTYTVGSLALGASGSVTFVVRIDPSVVGDVVFTNEVRIGDNGASGADYNPADNVATVTVTGGALPDLWAVKNDNVGAGALGGAMVGALANMPSGPGILQLIHTLDDIGVQQVPEGSLITYTIGYGNSSQGVGSATGVVLSDTLPLYTTYAGPTCGQPYGWCQVDATRYYTYYIGTLTHGQGDYVYFTVRVTNTLPSTVSEIVNTVCIDGAQNDLIPSNDCSSEQTQVVTGTYDLSVTKVENATCLNAGDALGYIITVRNQGANSATNVVLREVLPANTTYLGLPGPGWTDAGGGIYTYNLGVLASSAVTTTQFWVQINPALPPSVTAITNTVSVQADGADSNPANNSFTLVTPLGTTPDLVITKNDNTSSPITASGYITYTIIFMNNSNRYTATKVIITDTLPLGTVITGGSQFVWSQAGSGVYTYAPSGGTLGPNSVGSVQLTVQVTSTTPYPFGSEVVNRAEIRGAEAECDLADNVTTEETPVFGADAADLAVTKDDDVPFCAVPGDVVRYAISYTNYSYYISATNVVLTETIDTAAVTFLGPPEWSAAGGGNYTRSPVTPTVAPRASGTLDFYARIAPTIPPGQEVITNRVRIGTTSTDWNLANNEYVLTTSVPSWPDLIVVKNDNIGSLGASAMGEMDDLISRLHFSPEALALLQGSALGGGQVGAMAEYIDPGGIITYTVILGNVGRASSSGVVLTDTLPAGTTFRGPGYWHQVGSSNLYTYSAGSLGAGIGDVLQFIVQVNAPFTTGSRVLNMVQIGGSGQECKTANNTSTEETPVRGAGYPYRYYFPIIIKNYPPPAPTPTPTPRPPTPTPGPTPPPPVCAPQDLGSITVGNDPRGLAIDPSRNRVYVANYGSNSVSVINSLSNTVIYTITGASGITAANGVAFDPQRNVIWVTNYSSDQVTPIQAYDSPTTYTVRPAISVGAKPWGVAYNPTNGKVYVVNRDGNSVTVINAGTLSVTKVLTDSFSQPYHVAVNPVTNKVYVTNFGDHSVTVINGANDAISGTVSLNTSDPSTQPYGIAVDEMRNLVYIATVYSHRIVVINGATDQFLGWAEFLRTYDHPDPVPLRVIAINPDMGPYGDGGHLWTTTSTADGSLKNQILLIPKGFGGGFHRPIPFDLTANPSEGIGINRVTDRVYATVTGNPGQVVVLGDNANPCAIAFEVGDEIGLEVFIAP